MPTMTAKRKPVLIPSAEEIRSIRLRLGLTPAEAADKVGVSERTWFYWEANKRRPSRPAAKLIHQLAKKL